MKFLSKVWPILALLIGLSALQSLSASQSGPVRIFVRSTGQTAHAHGYLSGYNSSAEFVLAAKRGQLLQISTSQGGATVIKVISADNKSDGGPGGISVGIVKTGDVRIVVTEHTMAESWSGPFTLDIKLN